jgi:hypothetical protein
VAARKPTKAQLRLTFRIGCQIGTEDIKDHAHAPRVFREIAKIGDALYFDAIRLDGSTVWNTDSWESAEQVAARKAGTLAPNPEHLPTERPIQPVDALSAAVAIARSASVQDIDWGFEPATEREAAIRKAWIGKQLADPYKRRHLMHIVDMRLIGEECIADDLWDAYTEAKRLGDQDEADERRREFAQVADELDGRVPGVTGHTDAEDLDL